MAKKKYSGGFEEYEGKLRRVMERLEINQYNYDWNRSECFIEFTYRNQFYRFEHSLDKAKLHNQNIQCVSDLFAQLVITLEDIARMSERGIYELSSWIEGMKSLPPKKEIPQCFVTLGFEDIPTMEELKRQYRDMAKIAHPDRGGSSTLFSVISKAVTEAETYLNAMEKCQKKYDEVKGSE